jgi:hypothetical protein
MAIKAIFNVEKQTVTFGIKDETALEKGALTDIVVLSLHDLSTENRIHAALRGIKEKLSDSAALPRDPVTGKSASDEEKMQEIGKMALHFKKGDVEWNPGRTGGGGTSETGGAVLRAVAAIQGVSVAEMKARIDAKAEKMKTTSRKLLNTLSTGAAVREKMAEMAPPSDVDDLLADLSAIDDDSDEVEVDGE